MAKKVVILGAGFAGLELATMDEAMELCRRYAEILGGTLEIDARIVDADA